jgi:FKBP-type peptidyl-prolyl cis-trans isomerase SlyD
MQIATGKTVTLEYTLYGDTDEVIESSVGQDPLTYVHGQGELIEGLEAQIQGLAAGDRKRVTVPPAQAYGLSNPEALIEVPKDHLPPEALQEGMAIQAEGPQGQAINGVVSSVGEDTVVVDFNHPLAGMTLHFDIRVIEVR